ncbi:MACPF domain-containing protein NSL1-like [Oryza brachyantha]|uniref:MACPF domain-containing protein NSL1-like n=1 Tax=Oryza brachyantha TaxID=4533 RepID=UPI001ADCC135|nr:MACPF domain-containing protein NSL1-like [Oryza brachyantha]
MRGFGLVGDGSGGGGGQGGGRMMTAQAAAEAAVGAVGCGYDLTSDLRLSRVKPGGRLVDIDGTSGAHRELVLPGGAVVPSVPVGIVADKGERTRFRSDVLSFAQMAEQVNQTMSVAGKIPSGAFNALFDYRGCWHKDAAATRSLCFDGRFVELYAVEAPRSHLPLLDRVKLDVPPFWDPAALAEFIDKYGTHVVAGVKMGGKDVVCIKQLKGSNLTQSDVQTRLKKLSDDKLSQDSPESYNNARDDKFLQGINGNLFGPGSAAWRLFRPSVISMKDDIVSIHIRRGGIDNGQGHGKWISTINSSPDVISMAFVPLTSLLTGVRGCGFLNHAVNLYLRYKPPIEELQQFLEFQVPRQWAPEFGELPLALGPRKKKNSLPSLQFTLMGPKLQVTTAKADSGNRPVTGIRLFLEGKKNNRLGVHLQHLSATPGTITITGEAVSAEDAAVRERDYIEPIKSPLLSHVCTAPVQYNGARIDDCAAIVTRAWLEVQETCLKKVLFLRLGFSGVASTKIRRSEWDGPFVVSRKSGSLSALISARLSVGSSAQTQQPPAAGEKVEVNSAIFPKGPPVPLPVQRMARYVDTTEVMRGPADLPGYWVVTGAKLCIEGGKVALKVKYSLLIAEARDDPDV